MIIDATNLLLGRMASYVAKQILNGEKVDIVNCEKTAVSGSRENVLANYKEAIERGNPFKGPFYPRREEVIVRRTIRGMLPWKEARGQAAYRNVMCYTGVPEKLQGKKFETMKDANISRLGRSGYIRLKEISKRIGKKNAE